ncbi:MAG: proteasome subunit alpha [Nitrospirae bacterium]|nr:proteasome subunit alpha [Candidatus Troglogloeales bacterium]MBI3598150.1 proteasome subunit alpha [Candidatus Troglogloeales bacterium]
MPLPYYVSPEQMMQDKAEYAKKGIAKGRSIAAMEYNEGVVLVADNPSSLNKISEVYDRIAFAGAGRYSEFENLRKAGIRHADMKGFLYSRDDVNAKSLVNAYSQALGTVFSQEIKPLEVEILVVAVGMDDDPNEIYRVSFDGSIFDEKGFTVIGGKSESVLAKLKSRYVTTPSASSLAEVVVSCVAAMGEVTGQKLNTEGLEVAILSRSAKGRVFRRLPQSELSQYLNPSNPA